MTSAVAVGSVRTELDRILAELGIEDDAITGEATLRADLELDSTETVQVALELGRSFAIKVKFEPGEDLTVTQVCELVVGLIAAPDPSGGSVEA